MIERYHVLSNKDRVHDDIVTLYYLIAACSTVPAFLVVLRLLGINIRARAYVINIGKAIHKFDPRKTALLILEFLCRPEDRDGCIGDLEEACADIEKKYGKRAATTYFWWQASRTTISLIWGMLKKWKWIALFFGALGWIERQLSR
jgi:hypothetical protein